MTVKGLKNDTPRTQRREFSSHPLGLVMRLTSRAFFFQVNYSFDIGPYVVRDLAEYHLGHLLYEDDQTVLLLGGEEGRRDTQELFSPSLYP